MENEMMRTDRKDIVTMPLHEIRVSVTGGCNHACYYCGPFSDGKYSESANFLKLSINQIEELGTLLQKYRLHIQITGGEPSIRKDLEQIFSILQRNNFDLGLTTNCSKMDGKRVKTLKENGLNDLHIHVPAFSENVLESTIRRDVRGLRERIIETSLEALRNGIRVEFNTPVTMINYASLDEVMDFCYSHRINHKLIEEVSVGDKVNLEEIKNLVTRWLDRKGIQCTETSSDPRWYGSLYRFQNGAFFRIAPVTRFLTENLKGQKTEAVLDGRYWVGGDGKKYVFKSTYANALVSGDITDLEKDLDYTIKRYGKK